MEKETALEKASGNIGTGVAGTLLASLSGGYLAPLLPVLTSSLANLRHQERVKSALIDVNDRLTQIESKLRHLSDNQFKLIGEAIQILSLTVNDDKIELLKTCIFQATTRDDLEDSETTAVTRALRDISAHQFRALVKYRDVDEIVIYEKIDLSDKEEKRAWLLTGSEEAFTIFELSSLGLLAIVASGAGGGIHYQYTRAGRNLIQLCLV